MFPPHPPPMNLHVDIPTRAQLDRLLGAGDPASVSIYLPTDPASNGVAEQIELKNLLGEAVRQLEAANVDRGSVSAIADAVEDLGDDEAFWRYQARSLALFVTPETITTFRLPNRLTAIVEVSDRFHLKPLLRSVTFPQVAFVLALAQGSVRLLEVLPDLEPSEISIPGLPKDVASAAGQSAITDRSPSRRLQGSEGQKVRQRQYARQIDGALRPFLAGLDIPLILAAAEPLASIYRSVNTYPHLASTVIPGNPESTSDVDLAAGARGVLDRLYADELREIHELYARRASEHRAAADVVDVARAATYGAVDTVLVDIDRVTPGVIDGETGAVTFAGASGASSYGVVDEIARRVLLAGGRVLAVRSDDIPGAGEVAAILRYAI